MAKKPLNALVLEDCEDDALLVVRELEQQGFDVTWERSWTATTMKPLLDTKSWDVVLSDYRMPGFDAPAALQLLQQTSLDLPFIVVSGTVGEEAAVAAMKNGAHDYLMKGNLARLGSAIERELKDARVRREHRLSIDRIQHLNRVLRAVRNVNQLITQEKDRDRLLQGACEVLTEDRGYFSVWIALMDEKQRATAVFESGLGASFEAMAGRLKRGELTHCVKETLGQKGVIVIEDPVAECGDCPLASKDTGRAGVSIRLEHEGVVYGLITVSVLKEFAHDEEEQSLFNEVADDIAFALHNLEREEARQQTEKELHFLSSTVEQSSEGMAIADLEGNLKYANHTWADMHGYESAEELIGQHLSVFHSQEQLGKDVIPFNEKAMEKGFNKGQVGHTRRDGTAFPAQMTTTVIKDKNGKAVAICGLAIDITEQKRAEEALRESEQKLREIIEHSQELFYYHDTEHILKYVSPQSEKILGYTPQEMMRKWTELATDNPINNEGYDYTVKAIETGERQPPYTLELKTRAGKTVLVQVTESPVIDDDGNVVGIAGALEDITERKQAEEDLEKSEERYREMFLNMGSCVAVYSAVDDGEDFILVDFNSAAERVDRLNKEEIVGKRLTEIFPGVVDFGLLAVLSDVWKTGKPQHHPASIYKDERSTGWRENFLYKLPSGEVIAIYSDLTKEKQAEQALVESEEKYRLLADNATDVIWMTDANLEGTYTSPSVARIRGYTSDEATAQPLNETLTPESLGVAMNLFGEEMALLQQGNYSEGKVRTCDFEFTCKDGSTVWTETSMRFLIDDEKNFVGVQGISRDITERKLAEKEKAALEEQLLQSQKMESVGRLAGGVAHDFNNLLTVILSSCAFMADDLHEGDPLLQDVREIKDAGDRAVALTRQLLAFSRRQMLQTEVIDLNLTLENLDKMLRRLIGEDIDIETDLDPAIWKVEADPGQIEQIVMNLAVNARDAMPGGGKLTLETANVELDEEYARNHVDVEPGPHVMLAVSDTGSGMDAETTAQIFDPFFTTKEKDKGTGLGLSMVYGIVKQHGGNIWVYSEPGKGTIFKIYLPRTKTTEMTDSKTPDPITDTRGTETVLVVEDEATLLKLAVRMLERKGYKVLQARDGLEGQTVANAHDGPIHLLLTDVVMPNMGGKELAQKLLTTRPELKVLYMSGYTDNSIVHHGVIDKSAHFVQKPFGIDALAQRVRQVLNDPK